MMAYSDETAFPTSPPSMNDGFSSGGAMRTIPVTASPMTFTSPGRGALVITGGTLSVLQYTRGSLALGLSLGILGNPIELNRGDQVRLTYLLAPSNITYIPR